MKKKIFKFIYLLVFLSLFLPSQIVYATPAPTSTKAVDPWDVAVEIDSGSIGNDFTGIKETSLKTTGLEKKTQKETWNSIFTEYKGVIIGVSGVGCLTMVLMFIILFMKLGTVAANPQERKNVVTGLLWTGLAAAGLGSVAMFVGFAHNILK